jgi:hypothetical protein
VGAFNQSFRSKIIKVTTDSEHTHLEAFAELLYLNHSISVDEFKNLALPVSWYDSQSFPLGLNLF